MDRYGKIRKAVAQVSEEARRLQDAHREVITIPVFRTNEEVVRRLPVRNDTPDPTFDMLHDVSIVALTNDLRDAQSVLTDTEVARIIVDTWIQSHSVAAKIMVELVGRSWEGKKVVKYEGL